MKKSARKVAKKTATKKAAPRRVLGAKIKVNRKKLAASQVEPGQVPLRTTARIFALNQAGALGLTLSKPQLRRATDRVEKLFRERGIGGARQVEQAQPVAPVEPSPERANTPAALDTSIPQAQTTRRYVDPPRVAQAVAGSAPRRPLDQAISNLENATAEIFQAAGSLIGQLQPLLPQGFEMAPGNPPVAVEGNAPVPMTIGGIAAKLDGLAGLIRSTRDALAL